MLVIFIAKDREEFLRYRKGFDASINQYSHCSKSDSVSAENDNEYLVRKCDDNTGDICVVIKICGNEKKDALEAIKVSAFMQRGGRFLECIADTLNNIAVNAGNVGGLLRGYLSTDRLVTPTQKRNRVRRQSAGENKNEEATISSQSLRSVNTVSGDAVLFVHWGGGSPLDYERDFQVAYDRDRGNVTPDDQKYMSKIFPNLRAFALSSRRDEFDVMSSELKVPKTHEELDELIQRFTFVQVKDFLTEYVANVENNQRFDLKSDDVLRRYLKYMRDVGISKTFTSNDAKWMKSVMETELKSFLENNSSTIDYKDDIVALFVLLIYEGVSHG